MSLSLYLTVLLEKKISIIALGNLDKSPPISKKRASYQKNWKNNLEVCQNFTNLQKRKEGPAIPLTLNEDAEDAVLEMVTDKIYNEEEVNNNIS